MKAKIFTLFLLLAVFGVAKGQLEVLYTPNMAVTIDGVIDESDPWQADGWVDQAMYKDGSTTDHSSKFQLLHDDDIIYLGVMVVDATPYNTNATTYQNDCAEVFFYMDGNSVDGTEVAYTASTSQSRFQRDETTIANDGNIYAAIAATDGFDYAVVSDDAGWVLEVAFPIAGLDPAGVFDGENFMFEIQTADGNATDDTRTGQAFWQDASDNQWQYVETFSAAHLSSDEVDLGISVPSFNQKVASVYVKDNMLNFRNVEGMVNVYSISGSLVKKGIVNMNGTMDISSLKSGIYIVKSDNLTAKVIK
jgi:hypothetical protein